MKYKQLLQNKRIVFVGGCPNIIGMGKGKEIDQYDVVIKSGGSIFLNSNEYYKDYGKRLDVLYVNVQFVREMSPLKIIPKGLKFICTKSGNGSKLTGKIPVRTMESMKIVNKDFIGATMGAYIFKDILLQNPKELYITGIDFFISKKKEFEHDNYQEYLPGYLPDKIRHQGNIINNGKKEDGHNLIENTKYIAKLFETNKNMKTDPFIKELMYEIISGKRKQPK